VVSFALGMSRRGLSILMLLMVVCCLMPQRPSMPLPRIRFIRMVSAWSSRVWATRR